MKRLAVTFFAVAATACSSPHGQSSGLPAVPNAGFHVRHRTSFPITHVVVIMQENRSFDNFFRGFPGAASATSGYGHGVKYTLQELPLKYGFDVNHYHYQFLEDYDGGKNDGWDRLIYGSSPYELMPGCPVRGLGESPVVLGLSVGPTRPPVGFLVRQEVRHPSVLDDGFAIHARRS